jgi:arylsulfatase A-like enzyme
MSRRALTAWLINSGAFWLAEILVSPTPTDAEPPWVLFLALLGYLAVGTAGAGLAWILALRTGRGSRLEASWLHHWLAFVPGVVLTFPVVRYALRVRPSDTATILVLFAGAAALLAVALRRPARVGGWGFDAAYACGALALWSIVLCVGHAASDVPLSAPTIVASMRAIPWAVGGLYLISVTIALSARASRTVVASLVLAAVGMVLARLFAPSFVALPHRTAAEPAGRRSPVPVILIVMDTTRADHLSVYGYPRNTTPELEAFAREAVVFDDAVAPSSWTLPSHASLFTSLFPLRHGADRPHWLAADGSPDGLRPGLSLDSRNPTLAESLRDHGYDTAAVASNFGYLDPAFGLDRGFVFYDASPNTPVSPRLLWLADRYLLPVPWAARYWRSYRRAEQVNRTALAWLAGRRSDAVFLFLNYMEPHRPWPAPGPRYESFAAETRDPRTRLRPGSLAPEMRHLVDMYDSQLAALDRALGMLLDGLRRLGLYDNALVIVTADHGESLGENAVVGHGKSLHAPELAIPLLIKYPSSDRVGRRATRVQLIDIFPTIAVELGIDLPHGLDGEPIDRVTHPILAEFYTDPREPAGVARGYQAALYEGARKIIVDDHDAQLLDIERDPAESHALPAPWPSTLSERRAWLLDRYRTLEPELRARAATAAPIDPKVERALQALGYLGHADR